MEKYGIINIDINTNTVDGTRIIEEIRAGENELVYLYGVDGSPVGMRYNDIPYYYGKNLFGDIVDIYDANGNKVAHYIYDAWGYHKILDADGNNVTFVTTHIGYINPIRYRGYYFDVETELYYLQTRYYDPVTGRFLNADALAYLGADGELGGYNLYTYCGNNPVMYVDPTGQLGIMLTLLIAVGAGLLFGAATEIVSQIYDGGSWNWDVTTWNWGKIGSKALLGAAIGLAYGLGGVAGGIVKGSFAALTIAGKTLTVTQSVGLLLGTSAVANFAAGVGAYALNTAGTGEDFDVLKGISEGILQAGKGMLSFLAGGMYVGSGLWQVGKVAKKPIGYVLSRAALRAVARYVVYYVPNYILENLF